LNRPEKKNALATPLLISWPTPSMKAAADATIRCVILTGGMDVFGRPAPISTNWQPRRPEDPAVGSASIGLGAD